MYPLNGPFLLLVNFYLASDLSHIGVIAHKHLATLLNLSQSLPLFHLISLSIFELHSADTASSSVPGPGQGHERKQARHRSCPPGMQCLCGWFPPPFTSLPFPVSFLFFLFPSLSRIRLLKSFGHDSLTSLFHALLLSV